MSPIRAIFVPGWPKYIPGLLLCIVFAFCVMNIHHLLSKYHKADAASIAIPKLEKKLEDVKSSGADPKAISAMEKKLKKHHKALSAVGGKVGDRWSWATFLYVNCQFKYVAMLLIGGIIIRNTIGVHNIFLPGVGIARPLIKPGIIIPNMVTNGSRPFLNA
jgi:hypothetical protein